jgi:hypothetical protein
LLGRFAPSQKLGEKQQDETQLRTMTRRNELLSAFEIDSDYPCSYPNAQSKGGYSSESLLCLDS